MAIAASQTSPSLGTFGGSPSQKPDHIQYKWRRAWSLLHHQAFECPVALSWLHLSRESTIYFCTDVPSSQDMLSKHLLDKSSHEQMNQMKKIKEMISGEQGMALKHCKWQRPQASQQVKSRGRKPASPSSSRSQAWARAS